jgi:hypothetical protein
MSHLYQPIISDQPEPGQDSKHVLLLKDFLQLLKEEEDYFSGQQHNTKLSVTRLRKIFYDKWGWDTQLVRTAALIKCRYQVDIVDCPAASVADLEIKRVRRYRHFENVPKCRRVTYRKNDRIFGNKRVGDVPEIYKKNHQVVLLPEGYYCDIGHTLAGLDALNRPQAVSPLPFALFFLRKLLPNADSNAAVCTWLGDIATTAGDFLLTYLRNNNTPLGTDEEQRIINMNAPGTDMLGNIDSYVIYHFYKLKARKGRRVSDILEEYYTDNPAGNSYRKQRFKIFAECIGLENFSNNSFSNESEWLKYQKKQLRNTAAFMVNSVSSGCREKYLIPWKLWRRKYEDVIKVEMLLSLFLDELKILI